ncbi:MAG: DUF4422 domain-containing protein [Lachnospira sp.]
MSNKIVIYGMGQFYKKYEYKIDKTEVVCYVDNNSIETLYENKPIIKVEQLDSFQYDYIVVFTTKYFNDIVYDLVWNHGVDINKIVVFQWYYNLNYNTKLLCNSILALMEKTHIKYICDINDCISKLGLWTINKRSYFCVDYDCTDKCIYDIALIDGEECCQEEINSLLNDISENVKVALIHVNNSSLVKNNEYKVLSIQGYIFLYVIFYPKTSKIYQISHKPFVKYRDDLYVELGVGGYKKDGILTDKIGSNISDMNDKINEITGLYEIWKNQLSDVVGINHYRRCFKSVINPEYGALSELEIYMLLEKNDMVVASSVGPNTCSEKEDLRNSINKEAFDRCWDELNDYFGGRSKEEQKALVDVFLGQIMFPCNMMITSKKVYDEYCNWLIPIVLHLVENVEFDSSWDAYSNRVIGFFAERMLTVWIYMNKYSIVEVPIQFIGDEGEYGK